MNIAIFTDTHFGCRNSSIHFEEAMYRFIEKQLIPHCKKNGIKHVMHLGDFCDNRSHISLRILHNLLDKFVPLFVDNEITLHIVPGNHDIFFRHLNDVHSTKILSTSDFIKVYEEPTKICFKDSEGECDILMVPWINRNNEEAYTKAMAESNASICAGHFEINGAKMYKTSTAEHGMEPVELKHFDLVLSGHFHHRNKYGNIQYIGAAGYYNWQDYADYRGFAVLDTNTKQLEFIENKYCLFQRFEYDDKENNYNDLDLEFLDNQIVQLVVKRKEDLVQFDNLVENIKKRPTISFKVIDETLSSYKATDTSVENITVNTKEMLVDHLKEDPQGHDIDLLLKEADELFKEAQDLEAL